VLRAPPFLHRFRLAAIPVAAIIALAVLGAVAAGNDRTATLRPAPTLPTTPTVSPTPDPALTPEPSATAREENNAGDGPPIVVTNPVPGSGQWEYAGSGGPVFGCCGTLRPYRVAVEIGLPVSVGEFTASVDAALGDYRGWTASGGVRFQRVPGSAGANFTVLLASPWTAYNLCKSFVDIRISGVPYTSCQAGAQIVINSDRYMYGSPGRFTGPLGMYRSYLVNHEVGHRLGFGHVHCPGAGQLAPVMQQQTLRMEGCQPNAWPYPNAPAPPPPPPTPDPTPPPTPDPTPTLDPTEPAPTSTVEP
jgi:hypothetical protein